MKVAGSSVGAIYFANCGIAINNFITIMLTEKQAKFELWNQTMLFLHAQKLPRQSPISNRTTGRILNRSRLNQNCLIKEQTSRVGKIGR